MAARDQSTSSQPRHARKFAAQLSRTPARGAVIDRAWFLLGTAAAVWLIVLIAAQSFRSWWSLLFFLPVWAITAYLVLPRLHKMLSDLYVPDYFFGRTRTADGLLGDPVNLGVDGSAEQLDWVMTEAGWHRADPITARSTWGIIVSTLTRRSYPTAPVSPLMLFGRRHDVAYQQEVEGNPKQRHHVRFWHCPPGWLLPGGAHADWLGAGTYDTDVGLSLFTLQVTHRIDENTDIERDFVVDTVTAADATVTTRVLHDFTTGYHSRNGGGDKFITDGDLPILDLNDVEVPESHRADTSREITPQTASDVLTQVPLTTITAVALLAVAALVDIFTLISGRIFGDLTGLTDDDAAIVVIVVEVIGLTLMLAQLLCCWFVLRGGRRSRTILMTLLTVGMIFTTINYLNGTDELALNGTLVGASLMSLSLLLLSSDSAGAWSRSKRLRQRPVPA